MTALDEQTVTVPGTTAAETILPRLADSLRDVLRQRDQVATQVERMLDAHPLAGVLTSMPGIGVRTAAQILLEVGDGTAFPTPGHLAAYAGLAPVTRRSGSSIRGEHPPRGGNKNLKRAFFLAAFAALADPTSRAYYDRNAPKATATTPPASASPDAAATSYTPCSATRSPTNPAQSPQSPLDEAHRDTPQHSETLRLRHCMCCPSIGPRRLVAPPRQANPVADSSHPAIGRDSPA